MVLVSSVRLVARKIEKWFLELMATTANNANMEEMYDEHCTYLPAMVGWFLFSALLNSYNKFVFGQGHLHFPCPLLMTSFHFAIQWMFAAKMCQWYPQETGSDRLNRMTWKEWRSISLPCGMVTSGDIGLSNLSMVTMSITFYTMIKASSPIFVLGFAYLFGIERITWPLLGVMAVIACGEFLTVAGEVDFVMKGFLMCTGASLCSGARWTLVQLKLQTIEPPIKSTIATMRLLAPSMFFTLALTSLVIEKPWNKFHYDPTQDENYDPTVAIDYAAKYRKDILRVFGLGATGGCIAVMMILCEFYLILHSSAVIMMIGGVIKEMTTIVIGVTLFGDKLNTTNMSGCGVVFLGVLLYKIVFHLEKVEAKKERRKDTQDSVFERLVVNVDTLGGGEDGEASEVEEERIPARSVELMDRRGVQASPRKFDPQMSFESPS